jgi:hypothetical protein
VEKERGDEGGRVKGGHNDPWESWKPELGHHKRNLLLINRY